MREHTPSACLHPAGTRSHQRQARAVRRPGRRAGASPGSEIVRLAVATALITGPLQAQRPVQPGVVRELQALAGAYPLLAATEYPPDSAVLIFEDSSLAPDHQRPGQWMFGPPVTEEEAAGCPPPKVLGRKLARLLYRRTGKAAPLKTIVVEVKAPAPFGQNRARMYYYLQELQEPWAGDRDSPP
ncbi:MAG TPA: hypothetical protein VLD58_15210 [Gemmatimonadales bacterium]|nr:hypothetical protein [Gemmatimonadales bacterium]